MSANRRKRTWSARNRLAEDGAPLGLHLGDRPRDGGPVEGVQRAGERPHEVERQRRHEEAHRRHDAGAQRVDHARAPEDAGHAEGVHGPGAAEGEDREALDVLAALDRVDARGARHALVGELVDAPGRLHGAETERPPDPLGDRVPSGVPVEPHLAAEEEVGVEVAQHEVGVGHGRLRAAEAVATGPGRAPALSGPTRSRRSASTRAIEPPPVPISIISITGTLIGSPLPFLK